jgi:TolB protein
VESEPAWSWDNKRIALVRPRKDASNVTHNDIYIINADGTNGHWWRPTPSPYNLSSPAWAPDGSEILVTVSLHADVYPAWLNLPGVTLGFYSDGMGGTLKGKDPSYNPAGDHITYVGSQGKTLDVMTVNGNEHKVLLYDPHASLSRPVFSPDGKRIALSMNDTDGRVQIFVRNANAALVRLTATTTGVNLYPSWSPDGSKITFMSTRIGSNQIWIMSATGASPKRLHISSYDTQPAFSH